MKIGHPAIVRISFGNPEGRIKGQWQFRVCVAYFEFIFTVVDWYKINDQLDKLDERPK